ncbi:MAG: folate-binding protein YgfZ [Gammaproteobacteria bacterium]|nr:folate-binding protein YgfZ [Gammaproteobacteria bacterium]
MNSQWKSFLQTQSAETGEDGGMSFGQRTGNSACALIDLSHLGLISVSGEDADTFLQGQVTNDVRDLTNDHFQLSACCTPKGRMQANFIAFRHQRDIVLQMPRETQQMLLKRLPMFILMSKVKVTDASDRLVCFGLIGDCAEGLLQSQFNQPPGKAWDAIEERGFTLLRHPGKTQRIEVIGEPDAMIDMWKKLAQSATPCNSDLWALETIRAGVPTVYGNTSETFIPQMTNMQLIGGVSFTKGCYTGQEIVARTKYLGKIKRRMYLAKIDSERCPQPGEELFSSASQSGQGAGRVVDARVSQDGDCEMLAVAEIACHDQDDVHIESVNGQKLRFQELPYSFEQN